MISPVFFWPKQAGKLSSSLHCQFKPTAFSGSGLELFLNASENPAFSLFPEFAGSTRVPVNRRELPASSSSMACAGRQRLHPAHSLPDIAFSSIFCQTSGVRALPVSGFSAAPGRKRVSFPVLPQGGLSCQKQRKQKIFMKVCVA